MRWPAAAGGLADFLGKEEPEADRTLGIQVVAAGWNELPLCEQQILLTRG